ncbi:MAG TPA: hypothetical protein VKB96_17630, partial [Gammaproteobacteria bacterium]|nr:hypothetical protein [Gammaproteobacteria bacterium]
IVALVAFRAGAPRCLPAIQLAAGIADCAHKVHKLYNRVLLCELLHVELHAARTPAVDLTETANRAVG